MPARDKAHLPGVAAKDSLFERLLRRASRRQTRYDVVATVLFTWKDEFGREHEGMGLTRDISMGSVFVVTDKCPPPGTGVHLILRFPKGRSDSGMLIEVNGSVLRVERPQPPQIIGGFATQSANLALLQEKLKRAKPRKIFEMVVSGTEAKSAFEDPAVAFDKPRDSEKARSKKQRS